MLTAVMTCCWCITVVSRDEQVYLHLILAAAVAPSSTGRTKYTPYASVSAYFRDDIYK